jgi:hypothetical protein
MQIVAEVMVIPAEGHGVAAVTRGTRRTPARLAAPGGERLPAHHTSIRCLQVARASDDFPVPEHG